MLELGLRCSRRRDDGPTREAKRYRAAWQRCRDDGDRRRLAAGMPGVAGACAIRDGEPRVRWAVEARLLAGEAIDAVARKVGLRPEAVAWFEALYFHITDRLVSRGYLVHVAIGPRLHRGPMAQDLDLLWKLFALSGGPEVLDGLIRSTWDAAGGPRRPGEALPEVAFLPGPMGLAIAATTLPEDLGGRSGSKALLRLAASERRYAARARETAALMPGLPVISAGGADPP